MKKEKKVIKHLKGDIKSFKKEAKEDMELIKNLKGKKMKKKPIAVMVAIGMKKKSKPEMEYEAGEKAEEKKEKKYDKKVSKVMREFDKGKLHSGSKRGPRVKGRRQALAIALSEAKRAIKKKK